MQQIYCILETYSAFFDFFYCLAGAHVLTGFISK